MKRFLLALSSGILLVLAWPTYGFPFLLFIAFVPLLWLEYDLRFSSSKYNYLKILGFSYLTFFIWNLFTTSWLWYADPFGASFAIGVNSLLMAILMVLYHGIAKKASAVKSTVFLVTLWLSFEKLHLSWEFAWPWLNLGNAFSDYTSWIQWYEYTGTFGGSLWVWIFNIFSYNILIKYLSTNKTPKLKATLASALAIICLPGLASLAITLTHELSDKTAEVVILQPNIDPYSEKYNTSNLDMVDLLITLSEVHVTDSTHYIIAPETVFAESVRLNQFENSLFKSKLKKYIRPYPNINILTGVSFIDFFSDPNRVRSETNRYNENLWYDDYNSAVFINNRDKTQRYDKSKLVVGVENFPYQDVLKPLIGDAMIDLGGTVAMKTTQDYRGVFNNSATDIKVGPIICYESVFGEFVTGYVRNEANFLSIITNDAWWNNTQGHKQHLSYAKLRAIETRRSIARSANTGISAIIDPLGRITNQLGYGIQGAISGKVELRSDETFYVLAGDYLARVSMYIALFVFLITHFRIARKP
ncbi:MAG: apolipoprotein N-acyltransferase [Winogradskyella sp.]|nr:apolipoprotein N-acyltransferase [Winogradskyella sp.]